MTKIVCTLGPSTDTPGPVGELVSHGMHVARLNFSHAGDDYTYPERNMALVRDAAGMHTELADGATIAMPRNLRAILVDTKGPEIRTGPLQGGAETAQFAAGCVVELTTDDISGEDPPESPDGPHRLQVDYKSIAETVSVGRQVLLDDGLIALEVTRVDPDKVRCVALNGGEIKRNKGVNLPGAELDLPALTEKDKRDLRWSCEVGADFVAASFIRTASNVRSVKAYLDRSIADMPRGDSISAPIRPLVISKIESKEGVDNFEEILSESDGIMVARGDLGVEIPFPSVFAAQKMMVSACNKAGKPVIVATQMLDSMQRNPRPTRAEVTDVGTAVLDGADAVMLSGETAAGKYPIESIKAMTSVVTEADNIVDSGQAQKSFSDKEIVTEHMTPMDEELDQVSKSAVKSARDMNAELIILITRSGKVARAVARHRPTVPVLAFCTDVQVARRLQLHRSLTPVLLQSSLDPTCQHTRMGLLRAEAIRTAKELGFARAGDRVVTVDRTVGKESDMHQFSHNMKVST
eukprot:CAMPEP_0113548376 /NCGR_PEP_ID=MMETSP0015_2-20120614/12860_1 /TAXON_ID=2838 /ORGANISM="Odontella" /LENGTH=521 /DNA_ID=CAMNT_0000449001 /DNA_START=153 /DNA_END=1714 /DNA_ORIENTATION=+ /assembly_acc=CAM_ASM_000160